MITAGTKVLCPKKGHDIGVMTTSMEHGDSFHASKILFEPGQVVSPGGHYVCQICGASYIKGGSVYTDDGWQPPLAHNNPALYK